MIMKEIILIRGPLGIGKSTVAKRLAKQFDAAYISIDQVLEELGLDKTEEGNGIPLKNFLVANDHVIPSIKQNLTDKKKVIIDGNFYHKEQIDHFVSHFGKQIIVITLHAPVEVCIERDRNRNKSYGEDATRAVHAMVSSFDAGTVIDTEGKSVDDVVNEILTDTISLA